MIAPLVRLPEILLGSHIDQEITLALSGQSPEKL
jgi:hypothetical protein